MSLIEIEEKYIQLQTQTATAHISWVKQAEIAAAAQKLADALRRQEIKLIDESDKLLVEMHRLNKEFLNKN